MNNEFNFEYFAREDDDLDISELAGHGVRILARLIDRFIIIFIALIVVVVFAKEDGIVMLEWLSILLLGLLGIQIYLLSTKGQTIGKKLLKIKIVEYNTGENGGFATNFLLRGVVNSLLSLIPFYGIIDLYQFSGRERRALHDKIAGTKVIKA